MGEVVNLRTARKQKLRAEKEKSASEKRALHGRTKSEKRLTRLQAEKAEQLLEGHRLAPVDDGKP